MIRCENCGFEYEDDVLKCPFCGAENTKAALKSQKQKLRDLDEEGNYIRRRMPIDIMRKADRNSKSAGKKIMLLIGLFFIIAVVSILSYSAIREAVIRKNVEKFQRLMDARDYETLTEDVRKANYVSQYEKYYSVASAYSQYSYTLDSLEWYKSDYDLYSKDLSEAPDDDLWFDENGDDDMDWTPDTVLNFDISATLSNGINCHYYTDPEINDNKYLGNEDALREIASMTDDVLVKELHMTYEEISSILNAAEKHRTAEELSDWAPVIRARIEER